MDSNSEMRWSHWDTSNMIWKLWTVWQTLQSNRNILTPLTNIWKSITHYLFRHNPQFTNSKLSSAMWKSKESSKRNKKQRNSLRKPKAKANRQCWELSMQIAKTFWICKLGTFLQTHNSLSLFQCYSKCRFLSTLFTNCKFPQPFLLVTWTE